MKAFPSMPPDHELRPQPQLVHRAMLDALVDLSPDPLWVLDGAGALVTDNSAFQRWWIELTGIAPAAGVALKGGPPQLADLQRRALSGRSIMANIRLIAGGIERTYTLQARPVETGGVAFTAREVAPEGEGSERAMELALLHLFASNDHPLHSLLTKTLEFLCATDHWDAATLWRIDGDVLRPGATWFESSAAREKLAPRILNLALHRGEGPPGRAWESGEVVWIADMLDESTRGRAAIAAAAGLHSVVAAPLVDEQQITGVLELFTHSIRPINEPTRRMLARTGAALGRLIERRNLLEQIERKGAEWLLTVDSISLPILLVGTDTCVVRLNRMAHELTGGRYDDVVGTPLEDLGEGEPWKTLCDIVTAVRQSNMTCTAEIAAGERRWDVSASPLAAAGGEDDRVVVVMRDTTELVRLQESVRRGEQLAALGELVAGVAHEVKNPLFGMSVTLDLLDQQFGNDPESTELTGALRKWIARLESLTENLLAFGRTWTTELVPGDLYSVLTQAIFSAQPLARDAGVNIEANLDAAAQTVLMDTLRLVLVFENLLVNAVQHSRSGDRVVVEARGDGGHVEVSVRDQGPGFNPDELSRVFQPFFTRRRGGTGLGLSIVQRIVDEHGGTVAASNAPQGGAVVLVRLPTYQSGN
ncbi:MAG TPA: ATP-binding protein [Thermoanaerobaculia bacterium]|jgi:signal transduction histidine kinase